MDTPKLPKLPPEEQEIILQKIAGTPLETQAILGGVIDPPNVRFHWKACKEFITTDPDTLVVKDKAIKLSRRDEPVLITGESGTGKELLARILHGERKGQFIAVNVCAVTDTLFESELFGHVKGAFTGADKDRDGLIRQADNGTLFLDEIGDMPLQLQSKILRVIANRTYRKVGSNFDEAVRCRIVAATHRDFREMISKREFRLDLYERLRVFKLHIKPLRLRMDDMMAYVGEGFINELRALSARETTPITLSGNVRQLLSLKLRYDVFGAGELTGEDLL